MEVYKHNKNAIKKVSEMFESKNRVCVIHATGTGKSYIAMQVIYDFLKTSDSSVIFMTSYNGIINIINSKLTDFGFSESMKERIIFKNYRALSIDDENLKAGLVVLDEFHHLGAPIWTKYINAILDNNKNVKVLGTSATAIRNLGQVSEEDLSKTFFENNVASIYELSDAIKDGILPVPKYITSLISIENEIINIEKRFHDDTEMKNKIKVIKDKIKLFDTKTDILKKNLKTNGKYIYFCPPGSDIKFIKEQVLSNLEIEDYVFYDVHSNYNSKKNEDMQNRFENDEADRLRIMFAIDMYNEGLHVSNIDGVIMGRGTKSNNIFYQQLGRCLSVKSESSLVIDLMSNIYAIYKLYRKVNRYDEQLTINNGSKTEELDGNFSFGLDSEVIDILDSFEEIKQIQEERKDYSENLKKIRTILENDEQIKKQIDGKSNYLYSFMRINKIQILKDASNGFKLLNSNEDYSEYEDAMYIVGNSTFFDSVYKNKIDKIYNKILNGDKTTGYTNYIYANRDKILQKALEGIFLEQSGQDSSEFRKEMRIYEENKCTKQSLKYDESIKIIATLIMQNNKIERILPNKMRNPHYEFLVINKEKIRKNAKIGNELKEKNEDYKKFANEMIIYDYIVLNTYDSKLENVCDEIRQNGKLSRILEDSKINPNYNFLSYNKQKIIEHVEEFLGTYREKELTENEMFIYDYLTKTKTVDRITQICIELEKTGDITRNLNGKVNPNYNYVLKNSEKIKNKALEGLNLVANKEDYSSYVIEIYIYENYIKLKELTKEEIKKK